MKANQKFVNADEAVSPVIAVILMVAITVVLAATVFVLVNDLGKNVGTTGPSLGMVSDSAGSSTSKWTVKVSSATQLADLTDYRFVLTTPALGQVVVEPTTTSFTTAHVLYADKADGTANRTVTTASGGTGASPDREFRIEFSDIDGNSKYSVGDIMKIEFDDDDGATWNADSDTDSFPAGSYTLEILHTPSGSSAGSLPRTF